MWPVMYRQIKKLTVRAKEFGMIQKSNQVELGKSHKGRTKKVGFSK